MAHRASECLLKRQKNGSRAADGAQPSGGGVGGNLDCRLRSERPDLVIDVLFENAKIDAARAGELGSVDRVQLVAKFFLRGEVFASRFGRVISQLAVKAMIAEFGRLLGISPQIQLDVIVGNSLKRVVLRVREDVWNRQRQSGDGRNDDLHSTSARRAAVKDRLGRDLVWRKLGLQMRAVFVKAGDDGENDRGSQH